ncbi:hypothetical protein [Clostridium carnis]
MSKKCREKKHDCCCQDMCCNSYGNGCGNAFNGMNSCVSPIIFLLIACGSGVLNNNRSCLIILLFLLCGGSFSSLFGGENCCC